VHHPSTYTFTLPWCYWLQSPWSTTGCGACWQRTSTSSFDKLFFFSLFFSFFSLLALIGAPNILKNSKWTLKLYFISNFILIILISVYTNYFFLILSFNIYFVGTWACIIIIIYLLWDNLGLFVVLKGSFGLTSVFFFLFFFNFILNIGLIWNWSSLFSSISFLWGNCSLMTNVMSLTG